jgi:hypothetical protein
MGCAPQPSCFGDNQGRDECRQCAAGAMTMTTTTTIS